jgi:predicted chitinase
VSQFATPHRESGNLDGKQVNHPPPALLVHETLASPGRPLDEATRSFMEPRFGQDFSGVRVHTESKAAESSKAVGALAYTFGQNIVFGSGQYAPQTDAGRHTLAHELTHVVQQQRTWGASPPVEGGIWVGDSSDRFEREAHASADRVANAETAPAQSGRAGSGRIADGQVKVPLPAVSLTSNHSGGVAAWVQRATDFSPEYRQEGKVRSRSQTYEKYMSGVGETKASSESGGHKLEGELQRDELLAVYRQVAADVKENPSLGTTIDAYIKSLNQAFRLMLIDTVEAQAAYIANAYVESNQFRYMTETEAARAANLPKDQKHPYQSDPTKVKLATSWLDEAAKAPEDRNPKTKEQFKNVTGYDPQGSINTGDWNRSFIGRGPIQVTHRYNYVQVIAILENRLKELLEGEPGSDDAKLVREAIDKIKTNPAEAANPKYAFLFSAAFMKMKDPKAGLRGDEKATRGQVTGWMGPQYDQETKKTKVKAYDQANAILMKRHKAEQKDDEIRRSRFETAETIERGRKEFWEYDVSPGRPRR